MSTNVGLKREHEVTIDDKIHKKPRTNGGLQMLTGQPIGTTKRIGGIIPPSETKMQSASQPIDLNDIESDSPYARLDPSKRQIRLIRVSGSEGDISCDMITVDLASKPNYTCLSYVWGEPNQSSSHMVLLNGRMVFVLPNLFTFLRELLPTQSTETWFWIDALCIDQGQVAERNHQVKLMGDIYRNAASVVAWLGMEEPDTGIIFQYLRSLQDPRILRLNEWFDVHKVSALRRLLNRSWFSRLWVVQEVALASNVVFRCGSHEMHFDDFRDGFEILESRLDDMRDHITTSSGLDCRELTRSMRRSGASQLGSALTSLRLRPRSAGPFLPTASLTTLVSNLTHFECSDPRDTVYGLLGLAAAPNDLSGVPPIQPDYRKSVLEVFTDFIKYSIESYGSLDVLLQPWAPVPRTKWSGKSFDTTLRGHVPSWIGSRTQRPYGDPSLQLSHRQNADSILGSPTHPRFRSSGSKLPDARLGIHDTTLDFTGSLFARGLVIGTIERISPRMAEGTVSKEALDLLGGIVRSENGAMRSLADITWQVLCCNVDRTGQTAPPLFRTSLLSLLQAMPEAQNIDPGEILREESLELVGFERDFLEQVQAICWNRRVVRGRAVDGSGGQLVGLAPRTARAGDTLVVLYGCTVPVAMRPHVDNVGGGTQWELLGEAYVHGMMDGEAVCAAANMKIGCSDQMFEIR